nr:immunoglobulin light chain junction region [Macaca mulatta]
CLQGTQLPPTF